MLDRKLMLMALFLLTDCATAARHQAEQQQLIASAKQNYLKAFDECRKESLTRKNALDIIGCKNQAILTYGERIGYPHIEVIFAVNEANLKSATEYSKGSISLKELSSQLTANDMVFKQNIATNLGSDRQVQQQRQLAQQAADQHAQQCQMALAQGLLTPTPGGSSSMALNNGLMAMAQMGCQ